MKVGVAITTKDRPEVLRKSLAQHWKNWPTNIERPVFLIVDDNSATPILAEMDSWPEYEEYGRVINVEHSKTSMGVARAKNRCMELLLYFGCDHLFLWDDDAYPTSPEWPNAFLRHPEGHLQYNYPGGGNSTSNSELTPVYDDGITRAYNSSRGVLLYYTDRVLARVGGMDPAYKFGFEHIEHSERIANAGLTTWAHQSPVTGYDEELIHALDADGEVESVIKPYDRRLHTTPNLLLLDAHKGRTDFISYHWPQHQVLTCLFTGVEDPGTEGGIQREPWPADPAAVNTLLASLGHRPMSGTSADWAIDYRVFHNEEMEGKQDDHHWQRVPLAANKECNVYIQRWVTYRHYLVTHPSVEKVWIVDCSDVEYLARPLNPFTEMVMGRLYIGYEPDIAASPWMLKMHEASRNWLTDHADEPLYNAGVLGGYRDVILLFIDRLLTAYRQSVVKSLQDQGGDMGYIQQAVHNFPHPVIWGPPVTSIFKAYQHDARSQWRHK